MVNEWVTVELYGQNNDGEQRRYTIADGVSVSAGTLLALTDPRTAAIATAATTVFAGVAVHDKEAGDGSTSIACYTDGVFDVVASGGIALGFPVTGTSLNQVLQTNYASAAMVIGYCEEVATQDEAVNVRLSL